MPNMNSNSAVESGSIVMPILWIRSKLISQEGQIHSTPGPINSTFTKSIAPSTNYYSVPLLSISRPTSFPWKTSV